MTDFGCVCTWAGEVEIREPLSVFLCLDKSVSTIACHIIAHVFPPFIAPTEYLCH